MQAHPPCFGLSRVRLYEPQCVCRRDFSYLSVREGGTLFFTARWAVMLQKLNKKEGVCGCRCCCDGHCSPPSICCSAPSPRSKQFHSPTWRRTAQRGCKGGLGDATIRPQRMQKMSRTSHGDPRAAGAFGQLAFKIGRFAQDFHPCAQRLSPGSPARTLRGLLRPSPIDRRHSNGEGCALCSSRSWAECQAEFRVEFRAGFPISTRGIRHGLAMLLVRGWIAFGQLLSKSQC